MFINYWKDDVRESGINLAFGRITLCIYAIWKLLSYEWSGVQRWPLFIFEKSPQSHLVIGPSNLSYIWLEVVIALIMLFGVLVGYRLGLTGFLSAFILAHLSGVHYAVTNSSSTFLPVVYLLLFIALFRNTDKISADAVRKTRSQSLESLNTFLKQERPTTYPMPALKWILLTVGIIYFFTGFAKVKYGVFDWASGENLARTIQMDSLRYLRDVPTVGQFLINITPLAAVSAWASVILELGLVITIIIGLPYWPFAIGLLGMHLMIDVAMNIFFFDQFIIFALFLPWDRLYAWAASDESIIVAYDEYCYFCARSLYLFKQLDVNGTLKFYSQSDLPSEYRKRNEVDLESAMFIFDDDQSYRGYYGFKKLFGHLGVFRPISWFMGWSPIAIIGERVYRYIAANRSRHFVCSIDK